MTMRAGLLDTLVSLFNVANTDDGAGGYTIAGVAHPTSPTVYACVEPADWKRRESSATVKASARQEQRISHIVTIRWQSDLASFGPDARLSFVDRAGRTRWLGVHTCGDPDNRGRWLELECVEGGPL